MKAKERMPQYLHLPPQFLWFDMQEWMVLGVLYFVANSFGGYWWLVLLGTPFLLAKYKAKAQRGYLLHLVYFTGWATLKGYPPAVASEFNE